jgi:hypothetical protein
VYFIGVDNSDTPTVREEKLCRLLDQSNLLDFIDAGKEVAVKLHFGEEGNTGFVKPEYVRQICLRIRKRKARAFVSDTNTLYRGRRLVAGDHLKLAHEHGFTDAAVDAEVVIADEKKEGGVTEIPVNGRFVKKAKVASLFARASCLVGVAHFKGHMMTGFGGALKNIGMGCAAREGKLFQHAGVCPIVILEKCVGCGACAAVCPVKAIAIINCSPGGRADSSDRIGGSPEGRADSSDRIGGSPEGRADSSDRIGGSAGARADPSDRIGRKSVINAKKCIGCASCIAACTYNAIDIPWEQGGSTIQEKMIEYVKAVLTGKENASAFINFAVKITKECDCLAKDDPQISPDVGFLASRDPVALDKATLDQVIKRCGSDVFKKEHPMRDGAVQLAYAQQLGIGSIDYELKEV